MDYMNNLSTGNQSQQVNAQHSTGSHVGVNGYSPQHNLLPKTANNDPIPNAHQVQNAVIQNQYTKSFHSHSRNDAAYLSSNMQMGNYPVSYPPPVNHSTVVTPAYGSIRDPTKYSSDTKPSGLYNYPTNQHLPCLLTSNVSGHMIPGSSHVLTRSNVPPPPTAGIPPNKFQTLQPGMPNTSQHIPHPNSGLINDLGRLGIDAHRPTDVMQGPGNSPHAPPRSNIPPPPTAGIASNKFQTIQPGMPNPLQHIHHPNSGLINNMGRQGIDASRPIDVMQERFLIGPKKHKQDPLSFENSTTDRGLVPQNRKNCDTEVFRCTLNAIPSTQALLNKVKLPLGLIIHPFKDLSSLPVISAGTIVRCKRCRTYINPFVNFLDERRWRCNLCFVINDIPEEFLHHPVTKTYGQPHTRPECTNSTLEFIAPQEYMVRPPQPAVYLFLFDVSHSAIESGYLQVVCDALLEHIDYLPGDSRTKIGILTYNGSVHFYQLSEGLSQPQMLVVTDIKDIFSPTPFNLLVNLQERKELFCDLLQQLPEIHAPSTNLSQGEIESQSALGAALQMAYKLVSPFGGRVTVFQQAIPTVGPGALNPCENSRVNDTPTDALNPSTDFYKKLALDCSANQVAVDFFFLNKQYIDIATLSCTSRFSAGDIHYYPGFHTTHTPSQVERLSRDLDRYLTRKIGFEAVMRIRCTRGLSIHTFHGNFFVRSTDLLALANINPDAGFGLNLSIDESLEDLTHVSIQAALLYTSSKGERRIRVHTMCFPVVKNIGDVYNNVDSDAVIALLGKMAVDRSISASIRDARDALLNALIDSLKVFKTTVSSAGTYDRSLLVPPCMKAFPLLISCLLKHPAFCSGISTKHDDRVFAMIEMKMQPVFYFLQTVHPDLYRVDNLTDEGAIDVDERIIPQPAMLPLTAASICRDGVFLLDTGWQMFLYVGALASREFLTNVLGVPQFSNIDDTMIHLPDLDNPQAETFHSFIEWLQDQRPHHAPLRIVREDSRERYTFMQFMREDKTESSMSLQEFLQHVQQQVSNSKK